MIEILEKLFGSATKVKIMRLFLFNPEEIFTLVATALRSRVPETDAKHNLALLEEVGLIERRKVSQEVKVSNKLGKKQKKSSRTVDGWILNQDFGLINQLRDLVLYVSPFRNREIIKLLSRAAKLKLVVLSGVFRHNLDARIDLLVVGDNLKKPTLDTIIKKIESEMGREIKYAAFETTDFKYRMDMYDKLVRDVFDYPHEKILDKIAL